MSEYVIGADGGGSKTHALALNMEGACIGFGAAGCGSHVDAGLASASEAVMSAIAAASAGSGSESAVACLGLSGADFEEDFALLRDHYCSQGFAREVCIVNDSVIALRSGSSMPYGVVVLLGSGANCAGISRDGREERNISQGYLFGDWGGGNWIGAEVLHCVYRAWSRRGPDTILTEMVMCYFETSDLVELARRITREGIASDVIRGLTPYAFDAAGQGDCVARDIVRAVGEEAGFSAVAMMERVDLIDENTEVVLGGSVFKGRCPLLLDTVREVVEAANPRARLVKPTCEPVVGAGLLALERAGISVTADVRRNMLDTLPSSLRIVEEKDE